MAVQVPPWQVCSGIPQCQCTSCVPVSHRCPVLRLQGQFGSRLQVDPLACMLACDEAPSCTSFSYNPTQVVLLTLAQPWLASNSICNLA